MPDEVTIDYEPGVLRVLQTKSETKAFYDKIANVYDLLAEHSERPTRATGLKLLAAAPGEHVLEIGFGTGHILAELANPVGPTGKIFGIDLSENMLDHARGGGQVAFRANASWLGLVEFVSRRRPDGSWTIPRHLPRGLHVERRARWARTHGRWNRRNRDPKPSGRVG